MAEISYLVILAIIFGAGTVLLGMGGRLEKIGLGLMGFSIVWAIVYPLAFGFSKLPPIKDVWEGVHILGILVGGIFTVYMKILEKRREQENTLGVLLGITLTLVWTFGIAIFRKWMHV